MFKRIVFKIINTIKRFFVIDWKIKLVILLVSFSLWLGVTANEQKIRMLPEDYHIEVRNLSNKKIVSLNSTKVKLKVATDRNTFQSISSNNINVYVDLANKKNGTYDVPVKASLNLSNITIVSISPSTVTVTIEDIKTKDISIEIILEGKVGSGKMVSLISPEKTITQVKGSNSKLSSINKARGILKLNNQSENFKQIVELIPVDKQGTPVQNVSIINPKINVNITITSIENVKSVSIKLTTTGQLADGYYVKSISYEPSIINIIGDSDIINQINFISTLDFNLSGLSENKIQDINLIIPRGITTEGNISQVKVTLLLEKSDITKDISVPIKLINTPKNKTVTNLEPKTVTVYISGKQADVDRAVSADFKLEIDLSSYSSSNTKEVNIEIKPEVIIAPDNVEILNVLPNKILIILE